MTGKGAQNWGRPRGSAHQRRQVWAGTTALVLGAIAIGVAIIVRDLLLFWIVAGVLLVVGAVFVTIGRPSSTSRVP